MSLRPFIASLIFSTLLLSSVQAAQTCVSTSIPVSNQDVNAISGSSDYVIAVADNASGSGQISILINGIWVAQTDPAIPNEDFNDVIVFGVNDAVIVGDDGAVVILSDDGSGGAVWTDISVSNRDYTTIWAYSDTDIYIAGDNGRIYHGDGTAGGWDSIGTNNNNDDFVGSWGDTDHVYFLDDDGEVFRYKRSTSPPSLESGTNPITPNCAGNIDFNGFTSDGAGNFYLFGENRSPNPDEGVIFKWDGVDDWTTNTCTNVFQTSSADDINAVSINPDGTFTAVGDDGVVVTSSDGTTWTEISSSGEDINAIYTLSNGSSIFGADNGSNQVCTEDTPHFSIIHDGFASTCAAEPIKIRFHDANHAIDTTYTGTINISTSSGNGIWSLFTGTNPGSFADNGNGSASYTFVVGDSGEIVLSFANTTAETLNLNISDGTYTEFLTEDNNLTFSGGAATATFSDSFTTAAFNNSDGSNLWLTDWTESGEADGALLGNLTATTGSFRLEGNDDNGGDADIKSLSRTVNLTAIGATAATLQFNYQRQSLERGNDRVLLETSTDGTTWTELDRFQGSGNPRNDATFVTSPVYNLVISATTQIRFRNDIGMDANDFVYFDDITITATGIPSPCSTLDHIRIEHDGEGLTCYAEQVTVKACIDTNCTAEYLAGSVIATLTPDGDAVTFTGNTSAYVRQSTVGLATLGATITSTPAPINGVRCFNGVTETCDMNFVDTGFRFTDGANPPNPITIGTQIAGKASNINPGAQTIALQAVRTDTSTGACVGVFADGTDVSVEMASQCNNPTTCIAASKVSVTNNSITTPINNNPNAGISSYSPVPLRFTSNSQAILSFAYPDVGQISLYTRYNIPDGSGTPTGNFMAGSSNTFVVTPATFVVTNIRRPDDTANPANTAATDIPYFVKAGTDFKATVEARDFNGNITPNYGNEATPEGVLLTSSLVGGLGLTNNLAIVNNTITGSEFGSTGVVNDVDGIATVINLSWPEVGIITITPSVSGADGNNYLGAGGVTGTTTGNVGRFIPHHFDTTVIQSCGTFTYSGQPFSVAATAMNNLPTPTPTLNYTGAFAFNTTLSNAAVNPIINFNATNIIPAASFFNGTASKLDVAYTFPAKDTIADTIILRANDADTGSAVGVTEGSTEIRSGRVRLENVFGPELTALIMPLKIEYYSDNTLIYDPADPITTQADDGFILNTDDSCTTFNVATAALTNYTGNLSSGETTLTSTGTISAGLGNIMLSAPGSGNEGSVNLLLNNNSSPSWLTYNWNVDCDDADGDGDITTGIDTGAAGQCGQFEPFGTASFGLYRGDDRIIYWREVF